MTKGGARAPARHPLTCLWTALREAIAPSWQVARCQTARLCFEPARAWPETHPGQQHGSLGVLLSALSTNSLVGTSRSGRMRRRSRDAHSTSGERAIGWYFPKNSVRSCRLALDQADHGPPCSMSRTSTSRRSQLGGSLLTKRSVVVNGHKTSASIERPFWDALREIAIRSDEIADPHFEDRPGPTA
jgi:Ribbon-helix-helix domain